MASVGSTKGAATRSTGLALPRLIETTIDEDPVEPGRELGLPGKRSGRLVEPDESLLGAVLGLFPIPHDRPGDAIGPLLIPPDKQVESSLFTFGNPPAQVLVGRLVRVHYGRSSHRPVGQTNRREA